MRGEEVTAAVTAVLLPRDRAESAVAAPAVDDARARPPLVIRLAARPPLSEGCLVGLPTALGPLPLRLVMWVALAEAIQAMAGHVATPPRHILIGGGDEETADEGPALRLHKDIPPLVTRDIPVIEGERAPPLGVVTARPLAVRRILGESASRLAELLAEMGAVPAS